jgi:membrane protein YdbS with pleckstrin-like domain
LTFQGFLARRRIAQTIARGRSERVRIDARQHGVVLTWPLAKAVALAVAGGALLALGWPVSPLGVLPLAAGALLALVAVWRWERTRLVVTVEEVRMVSGTLRRRAMVVSLSRLGPIEVEQGLLGRLLGYGKLVARDLEVPYVAHPGEVARLLR